MRQPRVFSVKDRSLLPMGVGMEIAYRALIRLGVRRRKDGWRRGAGLALREETTGFVLSALGADGRWAGGGVRDGEGYDGAD